MTRDDGIVRAIEALELTLLRSPTRSDANHLEQVLDDDMIEFGKSGRVYDKRSIVQALAAETPQSARDSHVMLDVKATMLSDDAVLLTYRLQPRNASSAAASLRSSVWRRRGGHWRLLFHQGTLAAGP
jgi:hypothetical protein